MMGLRDQVGRMNGGSLLLILLSLCVCCHAKTYYMDNTQDCGFIGALNIERGETVMVYAKTTSTSASRQGGCTITLRAVDTDATIQVDFNSYVNRACGVSLRLSGGSDAGVYDCGANPSSYFTLERTLVINLYKPNTDVQDYNFVMSIKQVRQNVYQNNDDSNPAAVGLVMGVGGGVFGIIVIVACCGVCCFRKYKARNRPFAFHNEKSNPPIRAGTEKSNSLSVGYTNESMSDSPMSKKKLLAHSDSSDVDANKYEMNSQRPRTLNLRGPNHNGRMNGRVNVPPPAPPPPTLPSPNREGLSRNGAGLNGNRSDSDRSDERGIDVEVRPKNAVLGALHSNSKFRKSFENNEREAEERAQRISSSSSIERYDDAPRPPNSSSRPTLPSVPKSPKGKKSKHAAISRNPRPTSMSSEELEQIEKGRRDDDANIKVVRDSNSSSGSEVVPIQVNGDGKRKPNTVHSMKPDRRRGRGKKKQTSAIDAPEPKRSPRAARDRIQSADSELDDRPRTHRDRVLDREQEPFEKMGSGRYSKGKGRKSPRPGKGFSHRRGRSVDQMDSRPTTPNSQFGSMEDLESLPPMQRSSSKNSLYASRSSLYDRRRRRKGSYSGSVASYRDDRSYRDYDSYSDEDDFDGYEKPLSRRDRERMYRSENDLGRRVKEIATQTLRETATQTGPNESVTVENKMLVKKKRRAKSVSSSGTQTTKKASRAKSRSTERLDEKGVEKSPKTRTKRSKSTTAIEALGDEKPEKAEKPKLKPKPRPRKSTSADTHLDDNPKKSASTDNLNAANSESNPYYPQSEGFQPGPYPIPPQGYPMMPPAPPGYQGQPGMPMQYAPQYPMNGAPMGMPPQGYPGSYPGGPPVQPQMPPGLPSTPPKVAPVQKQRNKSNWETLCEMTDGQRGPRDDVTETGSVASSVFTNNPALHDYGNPAGNPYYNNQQFYNYPPPPPAQGHVQQLNSVPDYENGDYRVNMAPPQPGYSTPPRNQSSWDTLNAMTGAPVTKPEPAVKKNSRTESVV